ncbi:MAG TPA: endonuclease/exonuclease/phosphatase family protein [Pseudonocardiaceae bacterium]|nr:endonuclease/exonuclease/phosphatase family protein [Pseudonocardiaceae bacterium]
MIPLLILTVLFAAVTMLRFDGTDGGRLRSALLALTPYSLAAEVVLGVVGLALGHWWIGLAGLVLAGALATQVAPRVIPARIRGDGPRLRVLSANLFVGRGDVKTVIELVREHRVDVLHLLELTPAAAEEFDRAGLFDLLPHKVFRPDSGGIGSGIAACHPLDELTLPGPSLLAQPSARLTVDGVNVEVVAVHPVPPTGDPAAWKRELAGLPRPDERTIRVLAGDFNATVDHAAFRALLATGYADAGLRHGAGLRPTWPARWFPPPVTIDHVLTDARAAVTDYRVCKVPGSDHHAVYAELALPT